MRKIFLYLFGIGLLFASCDIETSDNGLLDGYWHLVRVDTLETGNSSDLSDTRVFWGVQMNLLQAIDHDNDPGYYGYLFNFERQDKSLRIYNPHKHERADGDPVVDEIEVISPLGINALDNLFTINKLTKDEMILQDSFLRLWFKKM